MKSSRLVLGLALGAAAGAILTYLASTDEGKEMISELKKKGEKLKDDLQGEISKGIDMLKELRSSASEDGQELLSEVSRKGEKMKDGISHELGRGKEKINELHRAGENFIK